MNLDLPLPGCGVLYIAFGEKYRNEARRSMASLRRSNPAISVAVVTDCAWEHDPKPDLFIVRPPVPGFASKPAYIRETPFEATLFVDTDTVFARDPQKIFGLLRHYDIGVTFEGPQLNEPDGLELHTQCSSGVILYLKNPQVWEVLGKWRELHEKAASSPGMFPGKDQRGLNDQRYLAIAIARSRVRPVHLTSYLQFVLFNVSTAYSPPILYHGRLAEMEFLDDFISSRWTSVEDCRPRVWLPNLRGLLPMGIRNSDPLLAFAVILRRLWNELRWRVVTRFPNSSKKSKT